MKLRDSRFAKRYLGDKAFYLAVLGLVVPIIIQNSITNFVSLLDNIMVGSVNTEQMNGVSIGNQLMFVFNLCVFGGMSAASIFAAQFFGARDENGVRHSFRYSMYMAFFISAVALLILGVMRGNLITHFINDIEQTGGSEETYAAAMNYLSVMMWGLVPFAVTQAYASILRVVGETRLPMVASVTSVFTNLVLNYLFIFGHCGFPALQARGAALATVIARYVEMGIVVVVAHRRLNSYDNYGFLRGAYRSMHIPGNLLKQIMVKGMPLLVNEAFWSMGMTKLNQLYSLRGLNVVAALAISTTVTNLFNTFFLSQGTAASVLVGRALGAEDAEEARAVTRKIIFYTLCVCVGVGTVMLIAAPLMPMLFGKASGEVHALAARLIRIYGLFCPLMGFANCSYFILRAGGRTGITFCFDSVFTWVVPIPLVYLLIHYTTLPFPTVYAAYHGTEFLKDILGYVLLKKGIWIRNIVSALD